MPRRTPRVRLCRIRTRDRRLRPARFWSTVGHAIAVRRRRAARGLRFVRARQAEPARAAREPGDAVRDGSGRRGPEQVDPGDHGGQLVPKRGTRHGRRGMRMQLSRAIGFAIGPAVAVAAALALAATAHAQPVALPPPPGGEAPIDPYATGTGTGTGTGTETGTGTGSGTGTGTETETATGTETETEPAAETETEADDSAPVTGTARVGLYTDSDHTRVYRALAS